VAQYELFGNKNHSSEFETNMKVQAENTKTESQRSDSRQCCSKKGISIGMIAGICLGMLIGMLLDKTLTGMIIGFSVGMGIGAVIDARRSK